MISLALLLAAAQPAAAPPMPPSAAPAPLGPPVSTDAMAALAREIALKAFVSDGAETAYLDSFTKSFAAGLEGNARAAALLKARPDVRSAIEAAARAEALVQYPKIVRPALIDAVANAYIANFTPAELVELNTYYGTPQAQRLLRSFSAPDAAAAVAAAGADPVVARFAASPTGRKEKALSAQLAQAMVPAMQSTGPRLADAIMPKIAVAFQTAMARPASAK